MFFKTTKTELAPVFRLLQKRADLGKEDALFSLKGEFSTVTFSDMETEITMQLAVATEEHCNFTMPKRMLLLMEQLPHEELEIRVTEDLVRATFPTGYYELPTTPASAFPLMHTLSIGNEVEVNGQDLVKAIRFVAPAVQPRQFIRGEHGLHFDFNRSASWVSAYGEGAIAGHKLHAINPTIPDISISRLAAERLVTVIGKEDRSVGLSIVDGTLQVRDGTTSIKCKGNTLKMPSFENLCKQLGDKGAMAYRCQLIECAENLIALLDSRDPTITLTFSFALVQMETVDKLHRQRAKDWTWGNANFTGSMQVSGAALLEALSALTEKEVYFQYRDPESPLKILNKSGSGSWTLLPRIVEGVDHEHL